jgi:hypothetical protein
MGDQLEEVIKEIAAKHGIAVSRDDPILILQTINNRLLQDSARAQEAQLTIFKEEMEALTVRWGKESTEKAERVLNAALSASKASMVKLMQEGSQAMTEAFKKETEPLVERIAMEVQQVRQIAIISILASCVTLLASGIGIWAAVH